MAIKLDHNDEDLVETHEINVTPFIDVMLVLLIIFMVAAPLATVHLNVDLPALTAKKATRPDKPVFLTIKADLTLALNDVVVTRGTLLNALAQTTRGDKTTRIFLRADKAIAYGDLMTIMNDLSTSGYLKVGLVAVEDTSSE